MRFVPRTTPVISARGGSTSLRAVLGTASADLIAAKNAAEAAATTAMTAKTAAETAETNAETAQALAEAAKVAAEAVGNTNDTIIAGRINDPASATATALSASTEDIITTQAPTPGTPIGDVFAGYARRRRVDMLTKGAAADGATDDAAVFTAAKAAAGAKGVVHFPAKPGATTTTYYFAGTTPLDLSGTQLSADPGVVLSVHSFDYLSVETWKIITPITCYYRAQDGTAVLYPTVYGVDPTLSLHSNIRADESTLTALDFTTWGKRNYTPTAALGTYAAGTTTTAARSVTFAGGETSGTEEGVFYTTPRVGDEISVRVKTPTTKTQGYVYAHVNAGDGTYVTWIIADINIASLQKKLIRQRKTSASAPATEKTITLPDLGYQTGNTVSSTLAVRLTSATTAEVYINGVRFDRVTLAAPIADVGFALAANGTNGYTSTTASFADAVLRRNAPTVGGKVLNLCVVGDSISDNASISVGYADLIKSLLRGQPGVSDVTVTNLAHSGDTAAATAAIVTANSMAAYDYVLVMTGTNDVIAQTAQATYEANLATIANKVISDGSTPIFGLFPYFNYQSVLGGTGTVRANYALGAYLRQALRYFCATNSYALADVLGEVGAVGLGTAPLMWDGLHPNTLGATAVARAFARTVINALRSPQATVLPAERMIGTVHEDAGSAAPTTGYWQVGDRRWNTAPAAAGTMGWVCTTAGAPGTWKTFGTIAS